MALQESLQQHVSGVVFRPDLALCDQSYIEKRQLFLRSYHFSRKKTLAERIKRSFLRVKRIFWVRLRTARKLRRLVWLKLRRLRCPGPGGAGRSRPSFHPLVPTQAHRSSSAYAKFSSAAAAAAAAGTSCW